MCSMFNLSNDGQRSRLPLLFLSHRTVLQGSDRSNVEAKGNLKCIEMSVLRAVNLCEVLTTLAVLVTIHLCFSL